MAVVIPRFPDWYGPNVTSRPVGPIFMAALEGKRANWIGDLETPHDLVFIEDAATACIRLGETESAYGQTWHVPGPGPLTGRQFIEMVFQAAGTEPNIGAMGGDMLRFLGLFSRDHREMLELLYEFEEPLVLDGSKFAGAFPGFQYTPHQEAIRKTLAWFQRRRRR